jgi:ABC-type branched-subunit amino acid transport system substrate-binding protein
VRAAQAGPSAGRPWGRRAPRRRRAAWDGRVVAVALAVAVVGAACSGGDGGPARDADGTLRIAVLVPPPGTLDDLVPPVRAGAALAMSEITAAGAPAGLAVEAVEVVEAPESSASEQVDAWLAQGIDVVVGPLAGGGLAALGDALSDAGIVACTPSAAELVDTGSWVVRTGATDAHQAVALADEIAAAGRERVAIVRTPLGGGEALADRLVTELTARGVAVEGPLGLAADGSDAAEVAARLAGGTVDGLVLATVPDPGIALLDALTAVGLPPSELPTWATGGMLTPELGTLAEPAVIGELRGVAPAAAPEAPEFLAALRAADPAIAPFYAAQAHDCVVLAALAAAAAGGDDPEDLRAAIGAVAAAGQPCEGYAGCLPLVAQGVDVDASGPSGSLDLDGEGEPAAAAVDRWEVRADGSLVVVGQVVVPLVAPAAATSTTGGSTTTAVGQVSTSSEGTATTASSAAG